VNRTDMELFLRRQRSECRRAQREGRIAEGCAELNKAFIDLLGEAADVENELPGRGYEVIREAAKDALDDDEDNEPCEDS